MSAARHQVEFFLHLARSISQRGFQFVPRAENMRTLALLGISVQDAKETILGLTPEDYVSGPSPHVKLDGREVWVFGLRIEGVDVYVKLVVVLDPEECACISFHEAERPMEYPHRAGLLER